MIGEVAQTVLTGYPLTIWPAKFSTVSIKKIFSASKVTFINKHIHARE